MEFKSLIFPIHTKKPIEILPESEYLRRLEPGTTLSEKQMNRPMIDPYSCTEKEKEELKKARRISKQSLYFAIVKDKNPICLYCHSEAIVPNKKRIAGYPVHPFFCPKCDCAIRNNKCIYCGRDISDLSMEYIFCRECLRFIDEEQFKNAYKDKIKEVKQKEYKPPEVFFQLCLEKNCKDFIDHKSNFWFCKKHWREYKRIRKQFNQEDIDFSRSEADREKIKEEYYEKVNPRWIWRDYYGPALELAKKGNYKAGQKILINFLKSHKGIPEYSFWAGYEVLGDLCFFDEDYERAISYYKHKDWNLDKVLNARRLSRKPMAGDEIIRASRKSFHVDRSVQKEKGSYEGYTKTYILTDFFRRNQDFIAQFAEEIAIEWERQNGKKLLDLGTKMRSYIWGNLYTRYLNKVGKDNNSEWYEKKLLEKSYNYHYCPEREFVKVIVRIVQDAESRARRYMGIAEMGEKWVSETELYYKIKQWFKNYEVVHHGHPYWLGQQHLDIFIPELKLAIEYQGAQHFRPIEFFGGEKAFKKIQESDKRKKNLCEKNVIKLIYVVEEDDEKKILEKLYPYFKENVR